MLDKQKI